MNAHTTDYTNIPMSSSSSVNIFKSNSKRTLRDRRYSLNFSDICSELAGSCRRNDGRSSSWSLSNLNASSHAPREVQPSAHRPHVNVIKIPSADNIRKLHKDWNLSIMDKLKPSLSSAHLLEDVNRTICCQPHESKNQFTVQNMDAKGRSNSVTNSVVHWNNSVEKRVCSPKTVFYGALYGLQCLK